MKYLTLKRMLWFVLIIIMIGFCMFYIQETLIGYYKEECLNDIYNYMKQEDSKQYFGSYNVRFGNEQKYLTSIFYDYYITNKDYIKAYLEKLNWKSIIINNKGNVNIILAIIREDYICYIKKEEKEFTYILLQNINLIELKEKIEKVLQLCAENTSHIRDSSKNTIITESIPQILENINWNLYIRTIECQNESFTTLIEILSEKIQNIFLQKDKAYSDKIANLRLWWAFVRNSLLFYNGVFYSSKKLFYLNNEVCAYILSRFFKKESYKFIAKIFKDSFNIDFSTQEFETFCKSCFEYIIEHKLAAKFLENLIRSHFK